MGKQVADFVGLIVGKDLSGSSDNQIKAELKIYIEKCGAEDLLVDDDLSTLLEIAGIYAGQDTDALMMAVDDDRNNEPAKYKRVGRVLKPKEGTSDKRIITEIADSVCNMHLDLDYLFKDKGVGFLDAINTVVSFTNFRRIEDMPHEYSGIVTLHRVKNKADLRAVIDVKYFESKQWTFVGKHNRCTGKYFTVTEFLDLISSRKIITFESL